MLCERQEKNRKTRGGRSQKQEEEQKRSRGSKQTGRVGEKEPDVVRERVKQQKWSSLVVIGGDSTPAPANKLNIITP